MLNLLFLLLTAIGWIKTLLLLEPNREDKNSRKILLRFFFTGLLSVLPASLLYSIFGYSVTPDDFYVGHFIFYLVLVGPVEEFSKFLVFFWLSCRLRAIKEPLDGLLLAAAVALGFATVENISYGLRFGMDVLWTRSLLCSAGHMIISATWGFYYGIILFRKQNIKHKTQLAPVLSALVPAAVIHGLYNFLVTMDLSFYALVLVFLALLLVLYFRQQALEVSPFRQFAPKDYKSAIRVIGHGLTHFPESKILNRRIGSFYLLQQDYQKAEEHLSKAYQYDRQDQLSQFHRSVAMILNGKSSEGEKNLWQSLSQLQPQRQKVLAFAHDFIPLPALKQRILNFKLK
jgi:RsiW-degrading membrane proteinase PrsW (M82 family)